MKSYIFVEDFNGDLLKDTISLTNNMGDGDKIIICMNSGGGSIHIMDHFCDIINDFDHEIRLTFAGSCALDALYRLKGKIRFISNNVSGMYHLPKTTLYVQHTTIDQSYTSGIDYHQANVESAIELMEALKFTAEEKSDVMNMKDIYFGCDRMKELFKYKTKK